MYMEWKDHRELLTGLTVQDENFNDNFVLSQLLSCTDHRVSNLVFSGIVKYSLYKSRQFVW